jgi:hypothetical protein
MLPRSPGSQHGSPLLLWQDVNPAILTPSVPGVNPLAQENCIVQAGDHFVERDSFRFAHNNGLNGMNSVLRWDFAVLLSPGGKAEPEKRKPGNKVAFG